MWQAKSPVGDISVVTMIIACTALGHSQKTEKVYKNMSYMYTLRIGMMHTYRYVDMIRSYHTLVPPESSLAAGTGGWG